MNIVDTLEFQARTRGDSICIIHDKGTLTYNEFLLNVSNLSKTLHKNGILAGDIVAHTFTSQLTSLVSSMACARLGATVFSVPSNMPLIRRREMLQKVNACVLLTDIPRINYENLRTVFVSLDDIDSIDSIRPVKDESLLFPWIIVTGSGSTGNPKYMPVTHQQELARMKLGKDWLPYSAEDTFLSLVNFDYYSAKRRILEAMSIGAAVRLVDSARINLRDEISSGKVSVLYGTVFHIEQILKSLPPESHTEYSALRALLIGGSTVSMRLRESIRERLSQNLYIFYGTNETHTTSVTRLDEVFKEKDNVGRFFPGYEVQIVDKEDNQLKERESGEIRIKSPGMINGYLDDSEATERAFREGWFYPGDIGYLSNGGMLTYLGRTDNMMIMNGINIFPAEIERVMLRHPDITDAIAFPLKHPVHHDVPVCVVSLKNKGKPTDKTLLEYARQHLGSSSPNQVYIVDFIPRNDLGKPVMAEINKLLDQKREKRSIQLDLSLTVKFSPPTQLNLKSIDLWMDTVLLNDINTKSPSKYLSKSSVDNSAIEWLWRCLALTRLLMQAAGMPVFSPPRILHCSRLENTDDQWKATVTFAAIDHYPQKLYSMVIAQSIDLAKWMLQNDLSERNREPFYTHIKTRILKPIYEALKQGKSTFPLLKSAYEAGIPFRHLGRGIYQLGWGAKAVLFDRSTTENDSVIGMRLTTNKISTSHLIRAAGLPAPIHANVATLDHAKGAAERIGWPVVVKPVDGERGEGVTVDVFNEHSLNTAFELALKFSKRKSVIIEKQVDGVCHRLFIANNKLLYAVKRLPMSVFGDGTRRIADLVADEFTRQQLLPPWKRTEIQPLDDLALQAIHDAGLTENTIPAKDALIPLRRIETTQWGGVDEDVTDKIHPENLRIALSAANLFRLQIAGIDIITSDISKPWHETGAIINEVNYSPLLGGGDISRRCIPEYLRCLLDGDGKIPVEVYVGGQTAWNMAAERQVSLKASGVSAFLTNHEFTITPSGQRLAMATNNAYQRIKALALSRDVEFLIIVVQSDEFLELGLPLEWVNKVRVVDLALKQSKPPHDSLQQRRLERLLGLLKGWELGNQ